jgi:hypothetical protein
MLVHVPGSHFHLILSVAKQSVSKHGNAKNGVTAFMRAVDIVSVATKSTGIAPR